MVREKLGNKMAGRERWNVRDKEFQLERGLGQEDRGYNMEPKRRGTGGKGGGGGEEGVEHDHAFEVLGHGSL